MSSRRNRDHKERVAKKERYISQSTISYSELANYRNSKHAIEVFRRPPYGGVYSNKKKEVAKDE